MQQYHVVSVSHIDMAFVMRKEAYAEMVEILLERIIGVLERNPEIHFALEQAAHYRNLQQRRPELFQKVKRLLKEGRLEFMGGMATTMETNFPNGECLIRNQGMGLRWLEEHLEVRPHSGWLVDTFGLNPQVPQIMEQFGFKYLHANRFGGNKTLDLFQAEGLNGSRVVVIGCDSASINVLPETQALFFCRSWSDVDTLFQKADRLQGELPKLVTYYIENEEVFSEYYLKLTAQRQKSGDWRHSTYQAYTEALEASGYVPPVVKEDLNPEFTGTFALRSPIKTENRKAENTLLNAEGWHALLSEQKQSPFDRDWWDLFHCQFHDAFTGSHEDITYEDILGKFSQIRSHSEGIQKTVLKLTEDDHSLVCCNSLPWPRKTWIPVNLPGRNAAVYHGEAELPTAREGDTLYVQAELPAGSVSGFRLQDIAETRKPADLGKKEIQNAFFRLVLNERFGIERLEDKKGFCYMRNAGDFLIAEEDRGGMQIEQCTGNVRFASSGRITVENAVADAMGESVEMHGVFPVMSWNWANQLSWHIRFSLRKGERMLRMKVKLNWAGDSTRIRLRLPLALEGRDFWNEVPFGTVRRETYRNLPTAKGEWPVQRFAALENGARGVALLNKGVAGAEHEGSAIAATLIRAYGNGPDAWVKPTALSSQHGQREFEFALVPYEGSCRDAGIVPLALEFNQDILAYAGKSSPLADGKPLYELKGQGLVLSTVKKAWDGSGDLIFRVYESQGKDAEEQLYVSGMTGAWTSNMKEEKLKNDTLQDFILSLTLKPYEIRTVRIARN